MNFYLKITFKKALHSVRKKFRVRSTALSRGGETVCIVGGDRNLTAEIQQASFFGMF